MHYPYLRPTNRRRLVTDRFLGLDRRPGLPEGAFREMENLSGAAFPMLATRPRRGLVRTIANPGGILAKDALITLEDGTLCLNGSPTPLTGVSPGEKQLVSMGARVLVFPDKLYYNAADPGDYGSLEADWSFTGTVEYALCDRDGQLWEDPVISDEEPAAPDNGLLWLDGERLCRWSAAQLCWVEVESVYTRLRFSTMGQIPRLFSPLDGVNISGAGFDGLNGDKILYALGGGEDQRDWIVLAGRVDAAVSRENETVRITRSLPAMDYVCECRNRLWGCRYGLEGGRAVNEIYASALGDPKNFRQYLGLSTDSWTASVGSDGPWTGAIGYLGSPCFFKEDRIHTVTVSASGAHRLDETACRGVQRGSARSLCLVGETLYYKARDAVCAWQGGFPQNVGEALGEEPRGGAVGGCADGRYYLSLSGPGGWSLLVYDPALGLWHREDGLRVSAFAALEGELYALEQGTGRLLALKGTAGTREGAFGWMAETGPLRYTAPDRQYLSRYDLCLELQSPGRLEVWLSYDDGPWERAAALDPCPDGCVSLPIRPRRCDRLRMRLAGRGDMRLLSLTRVLERGSDG